MVISAADACEMYGVNGSDHAQGGYVDVDVVPNLDLNGDVS
jgi:hypothetical protein